MEPDEQHWTWYQYGKWHHLQVQTKDIDPVYPWLSAIADDWGLGLEERAWLVMCHVIWYHPGSTLAAFLQCPEVRRLPRAEDALVGLPTGTERRGHRDPKQLVKHLRALPKEMPDGLWAFAAESGWNWGPLNDRLTTITGNGRWAAYKTAEMLQKVCGAPTRATDAGHRFSSGPRKGLADLYGADVPGQDAAAVAELDRRTEHVRSFLGEPDVAQVETSLCDFHSLLKGGYYLGHDIDSMQEALSNPRVADRVPKEAWEARWSVFNHKLLGELSGWEGVRRARKTIFRDTGIIVR